MKLINFGFRVWDNGKYYYPIKINNDILDINLSIGINDEIELLTCYCDKNGKELYEGDIVKVTNNKTKDYEIFYIDFSCDELLACKFNCSWKSELFETLRGEYNCDTDEFSNSFEIIGNIHENPEFKEKNVQTTAL
ncbi:hypothetical protein KJK76_001794 [Campylobacter jejuni]|nr:hypothetical protein [Campylobacter jejuni]